MAKYNESQCRICRREGLKLFLKGDRCYTDKCSIERRGYPPGQHGLSRAKRTDYGKQLREKQKVKRIYGILETQFNNYVLKATKVKGITGEILLQTLERRLDNVVYRLGFANSRQEARQLVRHGHFKINGRKVDLPSYLVKVGDTVTLKERSTKMARISDALKNVDRRGLPAWLEVDKDGFKGSIKALPSRAEITLPIEEQLIVEYYSR